MLFYIRESDFFWEIIRSITLEVRIVWKVSVF